LIGDNIRVNCINPGLVMTEGWIEPVKQWTAGTETTWQQYLDNVARQYAPIGRFATPQEVADFLTFLCAPRAGARMDLMLRSRSMDTIRKENWIGQILSVR
jgi:NAD(P)-dependent dehydrogenase (short-subunit alcohol dehydrogenase family)